MKKLGAKEYLVPFTITFAAGILIYVVFLPLVTYQGTQKYRDIIYGLANFNTNKSGELSFFKVTLLVISILIIFFVGFARRKERIETTKENCKSYVLLCCIGLNLGYYLIMGEFNAKIIAASIFCLISALLFVNKAEMIILLGICSYYTVTACVYLTAFLTRKSETVFWKRLSQAGLFTLTAVITIAAVMAWKKFGDKCLQKIILIEQIVIPFNFLMFIKSKYAYGENTYIVFQSLLYRWIIVLVCVCGILSAIWHFIRVCRESDWGKLIGISTVISIFSINSYIAPVSIVPSDFWHHGEQVTAWNQISDLGQELYSGFAPSSGGFAIPVGFLMKLFGGQAVSYAAAYSMAAMCVAIIMAVLCVKFADSKIALLIALGTGTFVYNRGLLILPYLLLLTKKELIENRSAWIKTWILFSMVCGIYYPSIGVSLLVATMPFGIYQLILFFKAGEWEKKHRSIVFWFTWLFVLTCVLMNAKMLVNMAFYVLSLAGQSLEADSFTLLVYTSCPAYFMPFLPDGLRYVLYLFTRVSMAGILVVLPVSLFVILGKRQGRAFWGTPMSLALSSAGIFLVLYQSYSLLRADTGAMIARTAVGVHAGAVYLLIVFYRHGQEYMTRNLRNVLSAILFTVAVLLFSSSGFSNFPQVDYGTPTGGIYDDSARLMPIYNVHPEAYIYTADAGEDVREWIGTGFISGGNYNAVSAEKQFIEQYGLQDEYFVNLSRFHFFLLDVKAAYVDSTSILQSKKAQDRMIGVIRDKHPVFAGCGVVGNYELVKWLQQNEYRQISNGWYVSPQTIQEHGMEALVTADVIYTGCGDYGRNANAFGKSFSSLKNIFDRKKDFSNGCTVSVLSGLAESDHGYVVTNPADIVLQVDFPEEISGMEYDYLYIELLAGLNFEKDYKGQSLDERIQTYYRWNEKQDENGIVLYWQGEDGAYSDGCACTMLMQTGELFIPVGYNSSWKNSLHNGIRVRLNGNFENGTEISLESVWVLGR